MPRKVIYSRQRSGFQKNAEYRNPKYFRGPLGRPASVTIVGDYPHIADAYRAVGVRITGDKKPEGGE